MMNSVRLRSQFALLGTACFFACARSDHSDPSITITGEHALAIGASMTLIAATEHGLDHAYIWASADPNLASVDAMGTVTALAPGEVIITAKGEDTKATGQHVVVITSSSDDALPNVPHLDAWLGSAHADAYSEAFRHWDEDGAVPSQCARCHSDGGFRDYVGDDGSAPGIVDNAAATGSVIGCTTCHNPPADALDSVEFPSHEVIQNLGPEARCMTCHQGRASTDSVNERIELAAVEDDTVSDQLNFQNVHYYPAGAVLYAGQARGGYQYDGKTYDHRFRHVPGMDSCTGCHDPHSTQIRLERCADCHVQATSMEGLRDIRMIASAGVDFDGDGNSTGGIFGELQGLNAKLYQAIQSYARERSGGSICYAGDRHPYFFENPTGVLGPCAFADDATPVAFARWTPRLIRAAYNYQLANKDPGAFAHNARYIIELLHDSITDLNAVLASPVDMSQATRNAPGHFNGSSEAARHWDEDEAVSTSCSKCHGGSEGFRFYQKHGVATEVLETANGLACDTCHANVGPGFDMLPVSTTQYPGDTVLAHDGHDNLCATCHSGRESKATIDDAIAKGQLSFKNVHYLPAAAVLNGSNAHVGYEYAGNTYAGSLKHANRTQCNGCHDAKLSQHSFQIADVWSSLCTTCHSNETEAKFVRTVHTLDYDGDGSTTETLVSELDGLRAILLSTMQNVSSPAICYSSQAHPYWFVDRSASPDGYCAPADAQRDNRYNAWTPALMKAAHNFQIVSKDPGAYAHNFDYSAQLLIDSIADLGADVSALVRP